jgi:pimeloyl-ACP methyl ester carboxylesterase
MIDDARLDQTVRLADGRLLGYAEFGDPNGRPLFYFHGSPGSRLEGRLSGLEAERRGIRLIAPDRPGFGLSDPKPGRSIPEWPDDVVELADALSLERFAVMGGSGGGPYAAACALRTPERLTAVGIVSGVGPFDVPNATKGMGRQNRMIFGIARRAPWLLRLFLMPMTRGLKGDPQKMLQRMSRSLPEPDVVALQVPGALETFAGSSQEALRQGTAAALEEFVLCTRPWGFRLEDIRMPVHLWQGELDRNVSPEMGRYQAQAIPDCKATFYDDEGHMSLGVNRVGEILAALVP